MILIDARTIGPHLSGIGRYTLNLLRGLDLAAAGEATGLRQAVKVWVRPAAERRDGPGTDTDQLAALRCGPVLELIEKPGPPQSLGHMSSGHRELRRLGVDLVHCPDVFVPWRTHCRRVITLHDVIPLVCRGQLKKSRKQRYAPAWRSWMKNQAKAAIRSGGAVITVSAYSRSDIQRQLGLPPQHLHVIHNAAPAPPGNSSLGPAPVPADAGNAGGSPAVDATDDLAALSRLGVTGPYVLNVGRRDPYKNVDGLVRAFAAMRDRDAGLPKGLQLVVAGRPDVRYPEAEREAARLELGDAVVFTGYVDDAVLAALYRRASVLAMPSLYEGFGLPAVEAMRAGTPVVAGAVASIPEVVGDAALLFDAHRPEALTEAMHKVLSDADLAQILVERGHARAELFTLEKFGHAHLELYQQLLQANPAK